jgi:hypothetical protein
MHLFFKNLDWAIGYFFNHFNISRHTIPTGHLHEKKYEGAYFYNDNSSDIRHDRLHAWDDLSESYKREFGNCMHTTNLKEPRRKSIPCSEESGTCHNMDENTFHSVHLKVKELYPEKYRSL